MKAKTLSFLIAGIFALALISFASATITVSSVPTLLKNGTSATITISSDQAETVNFTLTDITSDGKVINFEDPAPIALNGSSQTVTINYVIDSGFDFEFPNTYKTTLTSTGSVSTAVSTAISFETEKFCAVGEDNNGDLNVDIRDISVKEGFGEDDEWFVLDTVQVEVKVENNGNEDISNVQIEWGLYDTENKEWAIEVDEEDEIDVDEGDDQTITFTFTLDESTLNEDLTDLQDGSYVLYVRATGEVDGGDYDGEDSCTSDSQDASIVLEKDFVVLSDVEVPETVQCNSDVLITGDILNIGSKDQNDISLKVSSTDLGINEIVDIGDVDSMDSENLDYTLKIGDVEGGVYHLRIAVMDEDEDIYQNDFNDEDSTFEYDITVSGDCSVSENVEVKAVLEEGGQAGKDLVVKATIINSGTKTATYTLGATGYGQWANSAEMSQSTLSLNAGSSQEVYITLNVNKDAIGENLFSIEVLSNNELVASQPVSVTITKRSLITGFITKDNWHVWGIGLLNLILVIVIIVVAVRIARR